MFNFRYFFYYVFVEELGGEVLGVYCVVFCLWFIVVCSYIIGCVVGWFWLIVC